MLLQTLSWLNPASLKKPKLLSHLVSAYLIESGYFDVQHFAQTAIKITAYYHTIDETNVV